MRIVLAALVAGLLCSGCATTGDREIRSLRQQLVDRDVEIAALKAQLAGQAANASQSATANQSGHAAAPATEVAGRTAGAASSPTAAAASASRIEPDEERALEEALVRRGTQVLPRGQVLIEPEFSYAYADNRDMRRDTFRAALTGIVGLPWATQVDVRIPFVISDRLEGRGRTSGLGDISIGISKDLLSGDADSLGLVATARWYANTGRKSRPFFTGIGANAFQFQLTASRTDDPVVLFGSLSYTFIDKHGFVERGNSIGGSVGAYLAATPATSLFLVVSGNSNFRDRFNGQPIAGSSHFRGLVEVGATTVLRRRTFLYVSVGTGLGRDAPDAVLIVSLPMRY